MSGPIVRKYGFPNFEKIFGERPLEHGLDEDGSGGEQDEKAEVAEATKKPPTKKKSAKSKKE